MSAERATLSIDEWTALRQVWSHKTSHQRPDPSLVRRLISRKLVHDHRGGLAVTEHGRSTIIYGCPSRWSGAL
jgi:hypothetical protein